MTKVSRDAKILSSEFKEIQYFERAREDLTNEIKEYYNIKDDTELEKANSE